MSKTYCSRGCYCQLAGIDPSYCSDEVPVEAPGASIADLQRQLSEAQTLELEHQATIRNLKRERDEARNHVAELELERERFVTALGGAKAEVARLREALERISCPSQSTNLLWWQVEARAALQGESS